MADPAPLVLVMMGSKSDWEVMRQADEVLSKFEVPHECRVLSAHRTPAETASYVAQAEGRGAAEFQQRNQRYRPGNFWQT